MPETPPSAYSVDLICRLLHPLLSHARLAGTRIFTVTWKHTIKIWNGSTVAWMFPTATVLTSAGFLRRREQTCARSALVPALP